VLITRVHNWITYEEAQLRLQQIRDFEKMLTNNGTRILKFVLHISEDEQKRRLLERIDNADKHWKFSPQDLKERGYWDVYQKAFEDALSATSSEDAPWFVVPANHKWYRNLVVAENLVHALKDMDPQLPKVQDMDWKKLRHDVEEA
jgi:polyphosphate kinase 2 (PPK2 family)